MTGTKRPAARTASEAVAELIRARIATGALKPGDMLPSETTLLEEFGVARPTMREALRILESDGLVTILRGVNGGAQVRQPDLTTLARRSGLYLQMRGVHMGDLMVALRIVQPGAAALAATAATAEQIAQLRAHVEVVRAATTVDVFTQAATGFLDLVVQASGNETLAFVSTLLDRLIRVEAHALVEEYAPQHGSQMDAEFAAWCVDQYTHLIDLMEAGDAEEAEAFWGQHLHLVPSAVDEASALTVYQPSRPRRRSS